MFKKIFSLTILAVVVISSFLAAEIQYDIQDIGTLQTHSSQAIAINNQGQILGWYNIDGTATGKHFFVRDQDGTFHEIPTKEIASGSNINWRYLTDNGHVFGTYDGNANFAVLYAWDQHKGIVKLGNLPGKEISAINNAGQVLVNHVEETIKGAIFRPVIWHNGKVTKLYGLGSDLGIESEESYGYDINNNGDVVGGSRVLLSYKNKLYSQFHATKWINGQAIDLHDLIPKASDSVATTLNDFGDIVVSGYLLRVDGTCVYHHMYSQSKATKTNYFLNLNHNYNSFVDRFGQQTSIYSKQIYDKECIWRSIDNVVGMTDTGEAVATGTTIYGESHAMLLTPIKTE